MNKIVVTALREILKKNKRKKLLPQAVVNAARDDESPLHKYFQWDDGKAANEYRLWQARHLIGSVMVISEGRPEPYPAFVSLASDRISGGYRNTDDVLSSADLRRELLSTALWELKAMQDRYDRLKELVRIIKPAIVKVEKLVGKKT